MGAPILSHPFRLLPGGELAKVEQGTTDANAEQLAVLILTRRGERALVPTFGIVDPVFALPNLADINAGLQLHGPPVTARTLTLVPLDDATATGTVSFA